MVVLDTDVLIEFSKGNKSIINAINSIDFKDIAITVFNAEEFLFGLYLKNNPDEIFMGKELLKRLKIINYSVEEVNKVASLNVSLRKKGKKIGKYDSCIAGICLANNESLFTLNKKHFKNIEGISLFKH